MDVGIPPAAAAAAVLIDDDLESVGLLRDDSHTSAHRLSFGSDTPFILWLLL